MLPPLPHPPMSILMRDNQPLGVQLRQLAEVARTLVPDRRDPEAFHIMKNYLERRLTALAYRVEAKFP